MITKNRESEFEDAIRNATGSGSIPVGDSRQGRANFIERDRGNSGAHGGSMLGKWGIKLAPNRVSMRVRVNFIRGNRNKMSIIVNDVCVDRVGIREGSIDFGDRISGNHSFNACVRAWSASERANV